MNIELKGGCTRHVLLVGRYAIKIPRLNYGWQLFLKGMLGNIQEVLFSSMNDKRMCPVLFSLPGGFLLVMPRCEAVSVDRFEILDITVFNSEYDYDAQKFIRCKVPVERKPDSFGIYQNRIVAVDYGS